MRQAAEKLLKALLAARSVAYPLTHDLRALLNLVVNEIPELESFRERLLPLNPYAVEIRYDQSVNPDSEEITSALSTVEELRNAILDKHSRGGSPVNLAEQIGQWMSSRHRGSQSTSSGAASRT